MKHGFLHRLVHGHWPQWRFAPLNDYLSWRVCNICQARKRA